MACRARLDNYALEQERARSVRMPKTGEVRRVVVYKSHNEGLGISITGGKEHGVPILVSEVHPHMAAWRSGQLFVGDAILSVNEVDIRNVPHDEAVEVLSRQDGSVELEVLWIDEEKHDKKESEREKENARLKYHFYLPKDFSGEAEHTEEIGSIESQDTKTTSSPKTDTSVKGSDTGSLD